MTIAGQFNSEYTAVPPAAVEEGNSTAAAAAATVSDENRHAAHLGAAGWSYQYSHGAASSLQPTGYSAYGQWQHHSANGEPGPVYPAVGFVNPEGYAQYGQALPASNPATEWDYRNYQYQTNTVAVPPAVYYTPEGWAYYGNGPQYWNYQGEPSRDEIPPASNAGPYLNPEHMHTPTHAYGQQEVGPTRVADPKALPTPPANMPYAHPDGWQHRNALMDPVISEMHPRQHLPAWKWKLVLVAFNILSLINGYDVSNIANIQAPIYSAFGNIDLLPWIVLSYSVCNITVTPLCRKLYKFYDIKILTISGLIFVISGTAVSGAASSLLLFIIGRAVMAFGAAVVYQGILTFGVIFSYPSEIALVHASFGASFAFGVLTGPVIGAAFATTEHATWRWAFYLCLPILAAALLICIFALPSYSPPTEKSVSTHFKEIDWVGHILHAGTFISLSLATVFSGAAWPWGSIPQLTIWVIFVVVAVSYIVQQTFSIATKPERRIIPVHLLQKRIVFLTFLCTLGAGITYGVALYYTPLFYAFTRQIGPIEAGLRLLCLTAFFIVAIFIAHALLPLTRFYMPFFLTGGVLLLVGSISLQTVTTHTPLIAVMGFDAILGAGVGILWNLSIPVCSAVLEDLEDRLDQTTLHSIAQLGGTAISLSAAAAIYQNIGLQLVKDAAQFMGFKDTEILALLSGAKSDVLDAFSPEVKTLVIEAIVKTISRLYFVVIAGAVLCLVASGFLKIEPLEFTKWYRRKDSEAGSRPEKSVVYDLR